MRILPDASFAVRTLVRSPGYTAVVVLTLALGIGASTAIFSIVNAVVLRPLDYPEPRQLVRISSDLRGLGASDTGVSAAELMDYQSRDDLFAGVAGLMPVSANVTSGETPERVEVMLVSWNYFSVLGVAPEYGRTFRRQDDTPGVGNIAVVSHGFWQRRLGGDPHAVGRTLIIDDDPVEIVGVMPENFRHPGRTLQGEVDVWSPAGFRGTASAPPLRSRRRLEACVARLQPGVTLEQARARLADYGAGVSQQFASDYPPQDGWQPRVNSLQDDLVSGVATPMFVLLSGVGLLLLVACVNVAHLVLARSAGRRQEMAIRRALGAGGGRLAWQLVTESAVLAGAGGVLGLFVAAWALRGLVALAPSRVPRLADVSLDAWAILVAGLISLVVTVLCALVPALHARRSETVADLKDGGTGRGTDGRAAQARGMLVAAEVAMATMLLFGAGLFARTVIEMLQVSVGFETEQLLTARIALPRPNDPARATYLDPARRAAFQRETLARVAALPGVEHAAMSSQIPLGGFNPPLFVEIDNRTTQDVRVRPVVHDFQVSPSYFDTMRVRVLRGRPFADADRAGGEAVAIVSEAAVRALWNGQDALGARVRYGSNMPWMTVVGVASDVLNRRLTEPPQPILYRPLEQASALSLALLVRTRGETPGLGESIAREVRAVDPDLPVYSIRTMADLMAAAVAQRQFLMRLLMAFAVVATALAVLGIYGVMAYAVSQRTREIGLRMAIGARPADVSRMIVRRGLTLTVAGLAIGMAAALGLSQYVRSQLFGVQPSDPLTMTLVVLLMMVVAAVAAYLPARRAARIDPAVALRSH